MLTIPTLSTYHAPEGHGLAIPVHRLSAWDMIILCAQLQGTHTLQRKGLIHQSLNLIRKNSVLDPIEDDDDITWPDSPYEVNALDESSESPTELLALITIKGSPWLQTKLKALSLEFIDVLATKVRWEPAMVDQMEIKVDQSKCQLPCNRAPPRSHLEEKQVEIRKQVDALLKLGVIQESQ